MSEPHTAYDADRPTSAADALAIIEREQAHASSKLIPKMAVFYAVWGAVWLTSGVLYFLTNPAVAAGTTGGLVVAAIVTCAVVGIRSGRGVDGASSRQGLLYGLSWPITMTALGVFVGAMGTVGVPDAALGAIVPGLFALLIGALYLVAGAIWTNPADYALGGWVMAAAAASVFVGVPGNSLVLGLGVGGGLLARAGLQVARGRNR